MKNDQRFTKGLYTIPQAARFVGMSAATLHTWAHGYERQVPDRKPVKKGPIVASIDGAPGGRSVPFLGLVEATVVRAFRETGLPMQRIRAALEVLANDGELPHALSSRRLYTDGAQVLFDYAQQSDDKQIRLLTVVASGQRVFHDVIEQYLKRITFGDEWATQLILPITERDLLRVVPNVAAGDPIFVNGGAPLSAVRSRAKAGESLRSISSDYGTPVDDLQEVLRAVRPAA